MKTMNKIFEKFPDPSWKKIERTSIDCFGCGKENDHGLKMSFYVAEDRLYSKLDIPSHLRGWSNLVHGGVLATILDEIMAWAAMIFHRKFLLTKTMNTMFRLPVRIEESLFIEGYTKKVIDERNIKMGANIYNSAGEITTRGEGDYTLFDEAGFRKLNLLSADDLDELSRFLNSKDFP